MNRLNKKLASLKNSGRKALVFFVTAGYPDIETTKTTIKTLIKNGADIIEIGVPFSDPIADGPTIQASSDFALRHGINLSQILKLVKEIRKDGVDAPIVLMSYLNPISSGGLSKTLKDCALSGVDGFIIPDTIPEESEDIAKLCRVNGLSLVYLAAPNTPDDRLAKLDKITTAFLYVVSVAGVTGKRKSFSKNTAQFLAKVKSTVKHQKFLGFGISSAEQVNAVKKYVDGVIVGSALIDIITNTKKKELAGVAAAFSRSLRKALDK